MMEQAGLSHDCVDPDAIRSQFDRHRLRQEVGGAFGAVVPGQPGTGANTGRRGDVDDVARALAPKYWYRMDRAKIDALDVDGVHAVEGRLIDVKHGHVLVRGAGVVDQ